MQQFRQDGNKNLLNFSEKSIFDTSKCSILKKVSEMTLNQVKYCSDKKLITNYPLIGFAAIIQAEDREYFNTLK
jgi:hypothetical protein